MTDTDLHVLLSHAQKLFPRSPWTPEEWAIFAKKLRSQPFELAREAIEEHRADTSFNSPSIPKVLDACRAARHQEAHGSDSFAKPRTADDVVGEIRWTWQAAVRMYGTDHAIRNFASSDATRHVPELLRLGWSKDQIDVVIQEITGGAITDSFRDRQRHLRETWSQRRHGSRSPLAGLLADSTRSLRDPGGVRAGTAEGGASDDEADRPSDGVQGLARAAAPGKHAGPPSAAGGQAETRGPEASDDNDLRPGTFIDIDEADIPF